ncbi:MAG TPA: GAF and ANTAR domain-containing protein [Acidimicrobiales bacterium]|nr:GAF and ANTAR domain-containing protein [Acidimicrobiales bacterium]
MARESILVATLVELADNLVDNYDVIDILTVMSNRCVEAMNVDAAGVMLALPGGELQFVASSSESMRVLELFQIQANEGPCVDCYNGCVAVVDEALVEPHERWPGFSPRALALGFRSVHCLPMRLRGRTIGALNLFRHAEGALDASDVVVAQGLADVATIAILQHRTSLNSKVLNDQLSSALNSRIIIEQAKGVVSQATGCDMDLAFARLRGHARNHNERLTDVAARVIDGALGIEGLDPPGPSRAR